MLIKNLYLEVMQQFENVPEAFLVVKKEPGETVNQAIVKAMIGDLMSKFTLPRELVIRLNDACDANNLTRLHIVAAEIKGYYLAKTEPANDAE